MTNKLKTAKNKKRGIALYVAVTVTGILVLVSFAVISLAIRQLSISSSSRDSQAAFYAADSGIECALYWDVKGVGGQSAFATSTVNQISCGDTTNNPGNSNISVGGSMTSSFHLDFLPEPFCADVSVTKDYVSGLPTTHIESRGYNNCDPNNLRRVERAIKADY
ncbi:MAG: hypothetical protein A2653_00230 [Candidatus Zambryskibacteria bacterium RIFCSPHIGHO2_01_FULL_43_25]|uniref:Type 4 fimbrial biogenesis protein PilX N-terminal domain-containing protein n=1 Tax=Candidatus Zambryskibacteria bacterium RIFCSPLOWO2_01_FULL_45_21 TaxID=1802761 RepID=A0A1G2U4Q0_9BACT|nr:MAG: hypothetical protein A2653_00230 [Candidatus Zambryskibacteria bacterium RIFCSPHIGHO2_01_FULL_43_25]OHB00661.1 MAG: hypothetical protein A3E94_03485 [Candidatus Zambryskibacteria bacterium RIFCSPHIGHO2_12_FULL_44_12b]OHB04476.1 MAG: hypothetical protein A3B14_03525 [Candidatus Zambryskibacteria bacterium RIFCSPLOWO2_01_FULL_45_21]